MESEKYPRRCVEHCSAAPQCQLACQPCRLQVHSASPLLLRHAALRTSAASPFHQVLLLLLLAQVTGSAWAKPRAGLQNGCSVCALVQRPEEWQPRCHPTPLNAAPHAVLQAAAPAGGKKEQHGVIKGPAKGGGLGEDIEARGEQLTDLQILREVGK